MANAHALAAEVAYGGERKVVRDAAAQVDVCARYKALVEADTDAVAVIDAAGNLHFENDACERTLGYTAKQLEETTIFDLVHPSERAELSRIFEGLRNTPGAVASRCFRIRHSEGSWRWMECSAVALWHDPRLRGIVTKLRDVTDRRLLEEQLLQAQKMESVGRLAGGIAHDFNNLLSVILTVGTLAEEQLPFGDPVRNDLREILEAGRRAATLTRQLLAFSRKQVFQPTVIDVCELIRSWQKALRRLIGEDIELEVMVCADCRVQADPAHLEQVLVNLAVNARDAMRHGGRLSVHVTSVDLTPERAHTLGGLKPGPHVRIDVTDTGCGMDETIRRRIFEPFFTTKPAGKGTGLGLSTAYGIVVQSGGAIEVLTELDRGTTFAIYLPKVSAALTPHAQSPGTSSCAGTEAILLVEDDASVRHSLRRSLARLGYRVLEASTPTDALRLAAAHRDEIDLLLTDVVMPGLSGADLAKRIRSTNPRTGVLFMSGHPEETLVDAGIVDTPSDFIYKPVDPDRLARTVREALNRYAQRRNSVRPGEPPGAS